MSRLEMPGSAGNGNPKFIVYMGTDKGPLAFSTSESTDGETHHGRKCGSFATDDTSKPSRRSQHHHLRLALPIGKSTALSIAFVSSLAYPFYLFCHIS